MKLFVLIWSLYRILTLAEKQFVCMILSWFQYCKFIITVNFTYSEHGYSEFTVIKNYFSGPEFCPSLFNIKKYGYNEPGYIELLLIRNSLCGPKWVKSTENYLVITNCKISLSAKILRNLLSFSSTRINNRSNLITDISLQLLNILYKKANFEHL